MEKWLHRILHPVTIGCLLYCAGILGGHEPQWRNLLAYMLGVLFSLEHMRRKEDR